MADKKINRADLLEYFKRCSGLSTDTRALTNGTLFFALKGERFDGNKYAAEALRKGAAFCVVDDPRVVTSERYLLVDNVLESLQSLAYDYRMEFNPTVIGITGSNGKTTTKELLTEVLSKKFKVCATQGNLNNHIGVPLTLLSAPEDVQILVVEMGANHPGEIGELCEIAAPDIGYITNIGHAHLEGFGSIGEVLKTKTALYRYVCNERKGTLFVNVDDPLLLTEYEKFKRCSKVISPFSRLGKVTVTDFTMNPFLQITLEHDKDIVECSTQLIGAYNIPNVIASLEIGLHFGIPLADGIAAIENYTPTNNRSEYREIGRYRFILDAYNANYSSMIAAITDFNQLDVPNKLVVLGDMLELGEQEDPLHKDVVDYVEKCGLDAILFGPRFKRVGHAKYPAFTDMAELRAYISNYQKDNPLLILLKGSRGMYLEGLLEEL